MTTGSAADLKQRLHTLGLSDSVIEAVWPRWWSEGADESVSARAELRFGIARRLGMDPSSLLDDRDEPRFLWPTQARFKHLANESDTERAGISAFGRAVAKPLLNATPFPETSSQPDPNSAIGLREVLLRLGDSPFVTLSDLLALCWGIGIPVGYLRVFPWQRKRMAAMTVRIGDRWAILLARDSRYPAPIAFWLAHELGHIFLSHIESEEVIVDLDRPGPDLEGEDEEEAAADAFALELLTGQPRPEVLPGEKSAAPSSGGLAQEAARRGPELEIEPGTLVLCYGFTTGEWAVANGALKILYTSGPSVWSEINRLAANQIQVGELPEESQHFLSAVLAVEAG
jgi:hypothetical protein